MPSNKSFFEIQWTINKSWRMFTFEGGIENRKPTLMLNLTYIVNFTSAVDHVLRPFHHFMQIDAENRGFFFWRISYFILDFIWSAPLWNIHVSCSKIGDRIPRHAPADKTSSCMFRYSFGEFMDTEYVRFGVSKAPEEVG